MGSNLFDVSGTTVLVTGGSRGIGQFIAQGFVEAGATVLISARTAADCDAAAEALSKNGRCISVPADLSTLAGIERLVSDLSRHTSRLGVLVNNAGATWGEALETYPEQQWDTVLDVNLKAPFYLAQKLLPILRAKATAENPARIVNIGSVAGINAMARDSFAYAASKAGLHHLTRLMARHLAPLVTVNAIAPGAFETQMIGWALANRGALEAMIPRGTVGQRDDIAGAAMFFASRAGAYITGTVLPVDGGVSLRNP